MAPGIGSSDAPRLRLGQAGASLLARWPALRPFGAGPSAPWRIAVRRTKGVARDARTVEEQPALNFAGLLRQLRAEARLTQEQLAEAASLSPRSVSDLERGMSWPP